MDHLLLVLQEDRAQRLCIAHSAATALTTTLSRQMALQLRTCRNLTELDISLAHMSLDALRILLQGVACCPSLQRLHVTGGLSMIQAKVLSSCIKLFVVHDAPSTMRCGCEGAAAVPSVAPLTLLLEPSAFNDIAATILYDGLEHSTRVVDVHVRSSVSNPHILTVLPRFRRRVQSILKRNRKGFLLTQQHQRPPLQHQEGMHRLHQATPLLHDGDAGVHQHQQPLVVPAQHANLRLSRSPISRRLFDATDGSEHGTYHHPLQRGCASKQSVAPCDTALHPSPRTASALDMGTGHSAGDVGRTVESTTPSPTLPMPPEPAQFREQAPSHEPQHYACKDSLLPRLSTINEVHVAQPPLQPNHSTAVNRFLMPHCDDMPAGGGEHRPFQRHVITEMALLRSMLLQQARDVCEVRGMVQHISEDTSLQWAVVRQMMEAMRSDAMQHGGHQHAGPTPPPPRPPPAPPQPAPPQRRQGHMPTAPSVYCHMPQPPAAQPVASRVAPIRATPRAPTSRDVVAIGRRPRPPPMRR